MNIVQVNYRSTIILVGNNFVPLKGENQINDFKKKNANIF